MTSSASLMLDTDNDSVKRINDKYVSFNNVFVIPEDCTILFDDGKKQTEYEAKAGQIAITVYRSSLPNQLILINSDQILENIEAYEKEMQEEKERWAKEKADLSCEDCKQCN